MRSFKYNFLIFTLALSSQAFALTVFTDNECLDASFSTTVIHKAFPFGLSKEALTIKKENCVIDIGLERFKFLKNSWQIDVCREPIHIKEEGASGPEVLKKVGVCDKQKGSEFCSAWKKIQTVVQDDGLIFAKGEKEDLRSEHGRVYCSYLLLKRYLDDEKVMSRHQTYSNMLFPKDNEAITSPSPAATERAAEATPVP